MDEVVASALVHLASAVDLPLLVVATSERGAPAVRWANGAAATLLGREVSQLVHTQLDGILEPADGIAASDRLRRERSVRWPVQARHADGSTQRVDAIASPTPGASRGLHPDEQWWAVRIESPAPVGRERTQRVEDRFAALSTRSPAPTVVSDVGARLAHVNDAFARLLEAPAEELCGTAWLEHVLPDDLAALLDCVSTALEGQHAEADVRLRQRSGHIRWAHVTLAPANSPGQAAGFVGTVEDVTERLAQEHRLAYQARHDLLTGLPNRAALTEALTAVLAPAPRRREEQLAVLLLDLDDFKVVNDGLGHECGDSLLIEVAHRLSAVVRGDDVVARLGGDEFVLLCRGLDGPTGASVAAQRIIDAVSIPVDVQGVRVRPSASIGIVVLDATHVTAEQVLRDADIAMYSAKSAGKDRFAVADADAVAEARRSLRLVADLRQALAQRTLDVVYQPVVLTGDPQAGEDQIVSLEALCRWRHPELGAISPAVFVPLAEQNNLVPALDAHVLHVACRDLAAWRERLGERAPATVAVNFSAVSLAVPGLARRVQETVEAAGLQVRDLCLEITETAVLTDTAACKEALEELRRLGASVAVDDFGTGYSSLTYLRELPVDHLKVDRSFIKDLCSDSARSARAVTTAVVALARALGLGTIAEGVETTDQAAVVAELGCDAAQGYLYSHPLVASEILELLLRGGPLPHAAAPAPSSTAPSSATPSPAAQAALPRPAGPPDARPAQHLTSISAAGAGTPHTEVAPSAAHR
ncbi:putative bifunctional diguanylate cyclase/phosphodiesterase [Kineococcus xinjiangensis]|uniref:putative bifunctional diguanylate cyclase/phosphodiesterase n=1 Tax=Kineococcus xinjiangensis TaxID=512762 RepID=UPI0013048C82|nr:EAL domain-containing protein [Kineococcus xinjiangensis]